MPWNKKSIYSRNTSENCLLFSLKIHNFFDRHAQPSKLPPFESYWVEEYYKIFYFLKKLTTHREIHVNQYFSHGKSIFWLIWAVHEIFCENCIFNIIDHNIDFLYENIDLHDFIYEFSICLENSKYHDTLLLNNFRMVVVLLTVHAKKKSYLKNNVKIQFSPNISWSAKIDQNIDYPCEKYWFTWFLCQYSLFQKIHNLIIIFYSIAFEWW